MQSVETYLQPHLDTPSMPLGLIKIRTQVAPSIAHSIEKKESVKNQHSPDAFQNTVVLDDDIHSQAKHCISLIEDPLWKHVCTEVIHMMGPSSILTIWNVRLGSLSPRDKIINLYCQTEEVAEFIQQYAFVIIGTLQHYFPALKELNAKNEITPPY